MWRIALLAGFLGVPLVAQSELAGLAEFIPLVNTGALAVFLFGFYREWWVTGATFRDRVEECKETREEVREKDTEIARLNAYFQDEVIPAIIRFTDRETERLAQRMRREGQ